MRVWSLTRVLVAMAPLEVMITGYPETFPKLNGV